MKSLLPLALIGNVMYILFMVYNGIEEGASDIGTLRMVAPLGLILLLILNIFLLTSKKTE